jgi:hypothetical protein
LDANTLRYNILVGVDSLFEGTGPGYNDKQISSIINRAQREVLRTKVPKFDKDEKTKRMLAPLLKGASLLQSDITITADTTITNYSHSTTLLTGTFYTLPTTANTDILGFIVEETAILRLSGVSTDPVVVLPITYDYYLKNYKNRYKKPYVSTYESIVWRMDAKLDTGKPVVELIYPATHTVYNYIINYLRYPKDIVVNIGTPGSQVSCEIPDQSFQDEIIGEAIKIITSSLNEEGYQVAAAEKKFDEN